MVKKIFLGIFAGVLVLAPVLAFGATFKTGESYYLEPGTVIADNFYTAGGSISVAGEVEGDLFAAGGNVMVSGPVSGDLAAAGGMINITSNIEGDVRVAGGNVVIMSSVGGELIAVGGQISIMPGSIVAQDAKIAGGNINFAGKVTEKLVLKGDTVYINGEVGGDLSVEAGKIKLGPKALIKGNFDYSSFKEAEFEQGSEIKGLTSFSKTELQVKKVEEKGLFLGFVSFVSFAWIIKSLMIIVAALILMYLFRVFTKSVVSQGVLSFWKEALRGFVVLVVVPVAIILCLITFVGVFVGIILALFYALLMIISSVVSVLIFTQLVARHVFKKKDYELNWWTVILGTLVLGLISIIPFVGWVFTFIIFLSAFGSSSNAFYKKLRA